MAVSIGGVSAAVGLGSSLMGMFGGNDAPPAPPPSYQMQYQSGADTSAYNNIGGLGQYNTAGQMLPQAGQVTQNLVNNPWAPGYQANANTAAGVGWNVGQQQVGAGQQLMGAGESMLPYAQSILQTGFDPQQALYGQQFQLQQDQDRAGQAARGISMTPYGAGVENKANSDFNLNWQDRQLGRQNTAAQGAGYLTNSGANAINLGQNVSTLGVNGMGQAAALPYSVSNTIGGNQFGALQNFGNFGNTAAQIPQQQIQDYLQYLGIGNQSAGVQNQQYANQLTANNQQFNQSQTLGKNLGSSLSGLGTWYGKSGLGGGSSNPYYGPLNG